MVSSTGGSIPVDDYSIKVNSQNQLEIKSLPKLYNTTGTDECLATDVYDHTDTPWLAPINEISSLIPVMEFLKDVDEMKFQFYYFRDGGTRPQPTYFRIYKNETLEDDFNTTSQNTDRTVTISNISAGDIIYIKIDKTETPKYDYMIQYKILGSFVENYTNQPILNNLFKNSE